MSGMPFTPGPWVAHGGRFRPYVTAADDQAWVMIADCTQPRAAQYDETQAANARLIAAAPELYLACQHVVEWLQAKTPFPMTLAEEVQAAVAKAEDG